MLLCCPCAVPVLSLQNSRAGACGSVVPRSLALLLDPQTWCCPCREMPFVWGQEQLCASRARPWASLMWPRGRALPHGPGTVALCAGQGCAGWLQDVPNASPRVCAHISGAGRNGGFWTLAVFSSPLLSHIRSPCSWHFQDALEAALSCSGHWGLSKNAPKDLLCCGAAPKHKPGGPAVGCRDGIGRMGTWLCLVGLPGPFWCWKGPDNFRSSYPY